MAAQNTELTLNITTINPDHDPFWVSNAIVPYTTSPNMITMLFTDNPASSHLSMNIDWHGLIIINDRFSFLPLYEFQSAVEVLNDSAATFHEIPGVDV